MFNPSRCLLFVQNQGITESFQVACLVRLTFHSSQFLSVARQSLIKRHESTAASEMVRGSHTFLCQGAQVQWNLSPASAPAIEDLNYPSWLLTTHFDAGPCPGTKPRTGPDGAPDYTSGPNRRPHSPADTNSFFDLQPTGHDDVTIRPVDHVHSGLIPRSSAPQLVLVTRPAVSAHPQALSRFSPQGTWPRGLGYKRCSQTALPKIYLD